MAVHGHHCVNGVFNEDLRVFWEVGQDKQGLSHVVEGPQSWPIQGQNQGCLQASTMGSIWWNQKPTSILLCFYQTWSWIIKLWILWVIIFHLATLLELPPHFWLQFDKLWVGNCEKCTWNQEGKNWSDKLYLQKNLPWYNNRWFSCQVYQPKLIHNRWVLSK